MGKVYVRSYGRYFGRARQELVRAHFRQVPSKYSPAARKLIGRHIRRHIRKYGMPQERAVAAAISEAKRKRLKVPRRP